MTTITEAAPAHAPAEGRQEFGAPRLKPYVPEPVSVPLRWRDQANCGDADPELFFPLTIQDGLEVADRYCWGCPVKVTCGIVGRGEFGIWGGAVRVAP